MYTETEILLAKESGKADDMYGDLVAELIHKKYSANAETALINNYLKDSEEYGEEYAQYQEYREWCKQKASEIMGRN